MRFGLHIYHHTVIDERTAEHYRRVENLLGNIVDNQELSMAEIKDVKDAVERQTSVITSATTLLSSISQQLKDALANDDPAAVQAVVDELDANTGALAAAVAANTPSAPTP